MNAIEKYADMFECLSRSFTVEYSEPDQCFVARTVALPGCAAHGSTENEALAEGIIAALGILECMCLVNIDEGFTTDTETYIRALNGDEASE